MASRERYGCVTGAWLTAPGDALNILLHRLPIVLYMLFIATCGAIRLKTNKWFLERKNAYCQGSILRDTFGGRVNRGPSTLLPDWNN